MRESTYELGDESVRLVANFQASIQIAKEIYDPLEIMRIASLEQLFQTRGIPYTPPWKFDVENIPQMIYIGYKAAGGTKPLEHIQNLCFDAGFIESSAVAITYLTTIVGPTSEEEMPKAKDEEPKPKKTRAVRGKTS